MIKLVDLSFHMSAEYDRPEDVIKAYKSGYGYSDYAANLFDLTIVQHINYKGQLDKAGVSYRFFKSRNRFWHIPFRTLRFVKGERPDIILTQGLIFPLQIIFLRLTVGRRCKIVVQHHIEQPATGIKRIFQRMADNCVDRYFFTSSHNASEWISTGTIKSPGKCEEVLEGSTYLVRQNKLVSKSITGVNGEPVFLWVARLVARKDPITILKGFEKLLLSHNGARLYMIYNEDDLLNEVESTVSNSALLMNAVCLVGKRNNEELADWFTAADYYVLGSHFESSGFALIEAMACGCIPIVTDIPPFRKITGGLGFLFEKGNPDSLHQAMLRAAVADRDKLSTQIVQFFDAELSFTKIAAHLFSICRQLVKK